MAGLIRRNGTFYLVYRMGGRQRRVTLETSNLQIAKARQRQFELQQLEGVACPLPTKTPLPQILNDYVAHVRATKPAKSAQTNVYRLRSIFGPICEGLQITSRKLGSTTRRKRKAGLDLRRRTPVLEAPYFESLTTAQVAAFIDDKVRSFGLSAKTANHYRQTLGTLFAWAIRQRGVRPPGGENPARSVARYRESASEIRFLRLPQIAVQLEVLQDRPVIQTAVALYIYAGLRREEALWLVGDDVDLAQGLIRVRAKTMQIGFWQPKTRVNRIVPISSALRAYLERYTPAASDEGWYFPSPKGKWWDPDNFSADLRNINSRAGLPWACLDFRHTFGSQLAQKGVSLHQIAKLMGNSPEICRRHYAALIPEEMHGVVEFPPERPNGDRPPK